MGQTPTFTKPATTPEPTPKDAQEKGEPAGQPEPKSVSTPKSSRSAPHTQLDDMVATTSQILAINPHIADHIMKHMRVRSFVPLRPEDWVPLPAGEQPRAVEKESQRVVEVSPSTHSTLVFLRTLPMGKLRFIPRKEVGFSLGLSQ